MRKSIKVALVGSALTIGSLLGTASHEPALPTAAASTVPATFHVVAADTTTDGVGTLPATVTTEPVQPSAEPAEPTAEVTVEAEPTTRHEEPQGPAADAAAEGCEAGEVLAEDLSCVPTSFYDDPAPVEAAPSSPATEEAVPAEPTVEAAPAVIQEDDPAWNCRTMGNHVCGADLGGQHYNVTFDSDGEPVRMVLVDPAPGWQDEWVIGAEAP